ncbi:MAG: gamma-glutamyltransferase [Candidatus Eisenbacteria sp.]|nr:gamma-glutamyltransferase [Candidatus Eisenbacteria bacterium]
MAADTHLQQMVGEKSGLEPQGARWSNPALLPLAPRLARQSAVLLLLLLMPLPALPPTSEQAWAASPPPIVATDGMVVSESPEASRVGVEVLKNGGNAVDAAVAVHFALAVTYPQAGNLGGGGFVLIRMADGTTEAIDFRETAPAAAHRDLFRGADGQINPRLSTETLLGTAVPGSVAGMAMAHERHATRPWKELLQPAIRLAQQGFPVQRYMSRHLKRLQVRLGRHAETTRILLRDGEFWAEGDTLCQLDLGETLSRLARFGPIEFYDGETAELFLAEMARGNGIITDEDLRGYRPKIRQVLAGSYRGWKILTMPPPSSGGIALLQMLSFLEPFSIGEMGPLSSRSCHLLTEAMKRAFADRAEFLGDADYTPVPVQGLLNPVYLDSLRGGIDPERATPSLEAGPGLPPGSARFYQATGGTPGPSIRERAAHNDGREGRQTTHFSVVDAEGNAVAVTTTLNTNYGNGIMVTGAGFLLNNEMDDFAAAPGSPNYYGLIQGRANAVRPFARPLSSMTPTIVLRDNDLALVLGSPGGPKIITSVFQTLVNVIDYGMDIQQAIDTPRIHHQWWPDTLRVEPYALVADVTESLEAKGHSMAGAWYWSSVQAIQVAGSGEERLLLGASDPRRNGCPAGLSAGQLVSRCGACAR